jgi:hypothetical protein
MKYAPTLLMLSLTMLLGACASSTTQRASEKPAPEMTAELPATSVVAPSESILEYTGKFLAMPVSGQKEELARVHAQLAMNKYDLDDRTKAAAIYALSDASEVRDIAKAQVLLDELSREHDPDLERATLVRILKSFIVEHNKTMRENNRLSQKAAEEQKRAEALQLKLEELKQIEKNIVDRKVMDK